MVRGQSKRAVFQACTDGVICRKRPREAEIGRKSAVRCASASHYLCLAIRPICGLQNVVDEYVS